MDSDFGMVLENLLGSELCPFKVRDKSNIYLLIFEPLSSFFCLGYALWCEGAI